MSDQSESGACYVQYSDYQYRQSASADRCQQMPKAGPLGHADAIGLMRYTNIGDRQIDE